MVIYIRYMALRHFLKLILKWQILIKNEMMLKCAKSGLDLISMSRVTSYWNEWPRLIWPTLYNSIESIASNISLLLLLDAFILLLFGLLVAIYLARPW